MELLHQLLEALDAESKVPLFFNTKLFAVLFTLVFILQLLLAGFARARHYLLLAFSLYFYYRVVGYVELPLGGAEPLQVPFVGVLVFTALADWLIAQQMARTPSIGGKRAWLLLSVVITLGLLFFFKYRNFLATTWYDIAGGAEGPGYFILFPLGISYYTFKTLSYQLDVYYEEIEKPEKDFGYYLYYVSFFPNILSGPIHRATEFLPQLRQPYTLNKEQVGRAFFLFFLGLFKKVAIADYLGVNYVDRIFDNPAMYSGFENLMGSLLYGVQLFFDFSSYTEMALGIALLLGFELSPNFNEPFKAKNISEFWRRWHISLSTWFNDYVYTPLSFSWRSLKRWGAILAVLVTFFLSGIWHGPNWTFILWGTSHGVAIAWETATRKSRGKLRKQMHPGLYDSLSLLLTFAFLTLTYVFFKSKDLTAAWTMYGQIFTNFAPELIGQWFAEYWRVVVVMVAGFLIMYLPTTWKDFLRSSYISLPWYVQAVVNFIVLLIVLQIAAADLQPFIYMQF